MTEVILTREGEELIRATLAPGEYVIGREAGVELHAETPLLSRQHARLTINYDHLLLEDLGSSNGTFVNDQPVVEATRLFPNQSIRLGPDITLEVRRQRAPTEPGVSLAPAQAAIARHLPAELLAEKRYAIGGIVAQGGMGAILDARQNATQRTVAMKVMLESADETDVVRFIEEAQVTAQLEHPNIVPVHELGVDEQDQLFYTMKMVRGITLKKVLDLLAAGTAATVKKYPLPALLTIFQKVCDAIAFAHAKGVIHRDLKPENIMLGDFGEVLVMDWGLAKILGRRAEEFGPGAVATARTNAGEFGSTMAGSIMGTPAYMSPEQARGEIETLDTRSDIYALGVILFELLHLRPAVTGPAPIAVVEKVALGTVEWAGTLPKDRPVSGSLLAVCRKALAADAAARYASVEDLQRDLAAYQGGFATSAEQAGLAKQIVLLIRRHKGIFATATASWLLITALGVWFVINLRAKERRAFAGEQTALVEKEAARRSAAKASLSLAEASLREANGLAMQAALNDVPEDLRNPIWHYLLAQSDSSIARLKTGTEAIESVAADPTRPGEFAVADRNGKVTIMKVRKGERRLEFQAGFSAANGGNRYRIAFSPDGQHIALGRAGGRGGLVIHRAKDGTKEKEWDTPPTDRLEFGRNDALLRQGSGSLQVWNPLTDQLWWEEKVTGNIGVRGTFTPSGNEVVKYTSKGRLQLVKANDGSLIRELGGRMSGYDWFMAVRPDGKAVITWNETQITECVSLEDGRVLFALPDKKLRHNMGFSHDGSMLFTAALRDEGIQSIEVWNAQTGELLRSLLGGQGQITGLDLHPESHELLVVGADSRVWDTTGPTASWRWKSRPVGNIAFWGPEDWVFGFVGEPAQWGLFRLQLDRREPLWQPEINGFHVAETSADGSLAVLTRPGFSNDATLLRKSGTEVEKVITIKTNFWPYRLRPSPKGNRVAFMERVKNLDLEVYDAAGKETVKLDRADLKRISDLGWLGEQRLLGLLTLHAARGNPGSQENIVVWDADTGRVLQTTTHPTAMDALAVAPDGSRFAEAGTDKLVRIRDATRLAVQREFRAHDAPITAMAWHPTKPIIATGSEDHSVKVWNIETGRLLAEYHELLNPPETLTFSPTGRMLGAKTFSDDLVRIWQLAGDAPPPLPPLPPSPPSPPAKTPPVATAHKVPVVDGWEDLLAELTPAAVEQTSPGWRMENSALITPGNSFTVLPLPGNLTGTSFSVRVKLRELSKQRPFHIALPVADRMVGFAVDGFMENDGYTGVMLNGRDIKDVPDAVRGGQVKDSDQHDLEVTVRLDGANATITSTLDGRSVYAWTGAITALSQNKKWASPPGQLAIGTASGNWVVSEVKVKRL